MAAGLLRHVVEVVRLSLVGPGGPRVLRVRIPGDDVDPAELVEEGEVLVGGLVHAARGGVNRADNREVRRERVELKDRVALPAAGPRDENTLRDRALLRRKDRAELTGVHVARRLE